MAQQQILPSQINANNTANGMQHHRAYYNNYYITGDL